MRDLIKKILKEVSVKEKDKLGRGSFHNVYPFRYDSSKVIKVPREKSGYAASEYEGNAPDAWFNIFKKYPKYFPIVYKITDKYVILEKLDTKRVDDDIKIMKDELVSLFPNIANLFKVKRYDITEILDNYVMGELMGMESDTKILQNILNTVNNKDIFNRYVDLITVMKGRLLKGYVDINDGNFGYDKEGKLKMLDI